MIGLAILLPHTVNKRVSPTGDRTSLQLDRLKPNTYYWRVFASVDSGLPVPSMAMLFRVGPAIESGVYRMIIDGNRTSCGGSFTHEIALDGDLRRNQNDVTFGRAALPCGLCFRNYDFVDLYGKLGGSTLTGSLILRTVRANQPHGIFVNAYGLVTEVPIRGTVLPDGTITGELTTTLDLINVKLPSPSPEFCQATFPWSLAPGTRAYIP